MELTWNIEKKIVHKKSMFSSSNILPPWGAEEGPCGAIWGGMLPWRTGPPLITCCWPWWRTWPPCPWVMIIWGCLWPCCCCCCCCCKDKQKTQLTVAVKISRKHNYSCCCKDKQETQSINWYTENLAPKIMISQICS